MCLSTKINNSFCAITLRFNRKCFYILPILFVLCFTKSVASDVIVHCSAENKNNLKSLAIEQQWKISFPFESLAKRISSKQESFLSSPQLHTFNALLLYAIISIPDTNNPKQLLRQSGLCDYIGENHHYSLDNFDIPNDSLWGSQWFMERIGLPEAWGITRGDNVLVAVIDTGCDIKHKDLSPNIWVNFKEDINNNGKFDPWPISETRDGVFGDLNDIDDDKNGWTDDIAGYDLVDQFIPNIGDFAFPDPLIEDEQGHGTSVAGIIGAVTNNKIGISGIAPTCKLLNVRAFDATGNAEEDDIAMAIVYAAMQKSKVICMSFGDIVYSPLTADAIAFAYSMNCVLIASAGNDGNILKRYPASYSHVMAIGATTQNDNKASFSSYGSHISLSAPGIAIPTTARNNAYKNFQGTSASAPIVAGAAALLISQNPNFKNSDVQGILQSSAKDIGERGWDPLYGAGRVDILSALQLKGAFSAGILSPNNDIELRQDSNGFFPIIGSTGIPLFSSWSLEYGYGELPNSWITLQKDSSLRVINDTLGFLPLHSLFDTSITIKLSIKQTTNKTIEYRNRIHTVSSNNILSLVSFNADSAWLDNRKSTVIRLFFSRACRVGLQIRQKNTNDPWSFYADDDRKTIEHSLIINDSKSGLYDCRIFANTASDSLIIDTVCKTSEEFAPMTGVIGKDYSLPMTFLYPTMGFLDNAKNSTIIGTDYSTGTYGDTKIYSFANSKFTCTDSIKQSWIVKGIGDSNGDGISEILCHSLGEARLFTKESNGMSNFEKILFSELQIPSGISNLKEFWTAGMYDIDKDGLDDIIGFSDTSLLVFSFKNNKYYLLAQAPNSSPRGSNGSPNSMRPPKIACADFDKDGKVEIAYGDTDGDFMVFEYENGAFTQTFSLQTDQSGATEFTGAPDIDADGTPELLFGRYASPSINDFREYSSPLWTFTILKSFADNSFTSIHEEKIYGVRAGLDYKNGTSCANIDDIPGDEIIINAFPNLYIFGQNKSKIIPKWYYPMCYSNTTVTGDFDKNGKVDFGFGDGLKTIFAEFDNESIQDIPLGLQAISLNDSTAIINWKGNADFYEIYFQENPGPNQLDIVLVDSTSMQSFTVSGLKNNTLYRFFVKSLFTNGNASNLSSGADCYIHSPIKPIAVLAYSESELQTLQVEFSGYISSTFIPSHIFSMYSQNDIIINTAIPSGEKSVLLTLSKPLSQSTRYSMICHSFTDFFGSPSLLDTITFITDSLSIPDQELYITKATIVNTSTISITFSDLLDSSSASTNNYYTIEPFGTINSISILGNIATLFLDPSKPLIPNGKEYLITCNSLLSNNGKKLTKGSGRMIGFTLTGNADNSFAYPQPWYSAKNPYIHFAGLPPEAYINIYSIKGDVLATLSENDGNGGIKWNGKLNNGEELTSGVYLFSVQDISSNMEKTPILKKFTFIK